MSGLEGDGSDEPQGAVAIREGADAPSAPLDLAVQSLKAIGRADPRPMFSREGVELRGCAEPLLKAAESLGDLPAEALGEVVETLARFGGRRRIEDPAQLLGESCPQALGSLDENVQFVETRARELDLDELLVLSTQACNYFKAKAGFTEGTPDDLPPARRAKYEASGRRSKVLLKKLKADRPR